MKLFSMDFFRRKTLDVPTVSILREFVKPPYGGGNQFMLALRKALEKQGVRVLVNDTGRFVDGFIFDSLWLNKKYIKALSRLNHPRVLHRIDGPISLYRGKDKELDDEIFRLNAMFASATVIQSNFTFKKLTEAGYRPINPVIIHNAVDPDFFHTRGRVSWSTNRKTRLISTSWSDNPRKGGPFYKELEEKLDWSRFEYTFVGRCSETLNKIKVVSPVPSETLGEMLRQHDIYITASQNDPCSNALIEALASGLPALGLNSGGHPELIGSGGLVFSTIEEALNNLDSIVRSYASFQGQIKTASIAEVAKGYLALITPQSSLKPETLESPL